jgi:predicted amidohydrolase
MSRVIRVAAAQMGPTQRADTRAHTLDRLVALLEQAAARRAQLVVFPELAFTTFFPRWWIEDEAELLGYFEATLPGPQTQPLFDRARELGVGFHIGYAELDRSAFEDGNVRRRGYNSCVLVSADGTILGKYRKVHLPGSEGFREGQQFQQLEKRYFAYGDLGFRTFRAFGGVVGMMICNDRRWPESFRMLGMQGAELIVLGYNSAAYDPNGGDDEPAELRTYHSNLCAQAGAYQNAAWVVAVAKAGNEDGSGLIGSSVIVDPRGVIVAQAATLEDEVIVADADLDACLPMKRKMFDFAAHRRPEHYGLITARAGTVPPPDA